MANSGGGKSGSTSSSPQCVLKLLAPEATASAIIGKGGAVIASIRQSCQAKIVLSDRGEVYPQTDCRVLTAQADTEESLNEVCKQIISKVEELAAKGSGSEQAGQEGGLKLRTVVPRAAVGGIIGKGGSTIKQIRATSGGKISIGDATGNGPSADQIVSVVGSAEALEYVMKAVNQQVQELKEEAWFSAWAGTSGAVQAGNGPQLGAGDVMGILPPGVDVMMRVAHGLPKHVLEDSRGFAMSCVVPNHLVGGLIGRGGAGTKEVQKLTGTNISIREIPDDSENRSLNIAGPLPNTCAAYMMMMTRYLDAEAQASRGGRQRPR